MSCTIHSNHDHIHGKSCGHTAIQHGDHVDYLHDGHLHHVHGDHVDEHVLEVSEKILPSVITVLIVVSIFMAKAVDMKLYHTATILTIS